MLQWIFLEKIRGLDFTMRDTSLIEKSGGVLHGYSKTDEKHLEDIWKTLNVNSTDSIIDIGCGKGVVLRSAYRQPFLKICGIDIDERLIKIAKKNFEILKMQDRITVEHCDATLFEDYCSYNVFYFANPFDGEILSGVLDAIIKAKRGRILIIYYNPTYAKIIEDKGGVLMHKLFDPAKSYETYIYSID